jgi:L-rhamnose mutarotase
MARADATNPAIAEWEALMWTYQVPTPWTPAGTKWTALRKIFSLDSQR